MPIRGVKGEARPLDPIDWKEWAERYATTQDAGFDVAVLALKAGDRVARASWKDGSVAACHGPMLRRAARGEGVTDWTPTAEDVLADDWYTFPGPHRPTKDYV